MTTFDDTYGWLTGSIWRYKHSDSFILLSNGASFYDVLKGEFDRPEVRAAKQREEDDFRATVMGRLPLCVVQKKKRGGGGG